MRTQSLFSEPLPSLKITLSWLPCIFHRLVPNWVEAGYGLGDAQTKLTHLCFADDILLFSRSRNQMKQMLEDVQRAAKTIRLAINLYVTKLLDAQGRDRRLDLARTESTLSA